MMKFLRKLGLKSADMLIERILTNSQSGVFEIKSIMINGLNRYIVFILHFKTSKSSGRKLLQFVKENIGFKDGIPFPSNFEIDVQDEFLNDCTQQVVEYQIGVTVVNFNKIFRLKSIRFTIQARGPYKCKTRSFLDVFARNRPHFENNDLRQYSMKLIFYHTMFITQNLALLDIPVKVLIPIRFLNKIIFPERALRLKKYIEKNIDHRKKYYTYKNMFEKSMKVPYDELWSYVGAFILKLQERIERRFSEFLSLESSAHIQIINASLFHRRSYPDLPDMSIELTILVDYRDEEDKIIDLILKLDKEKLRNITAKTWRQISKKR